MKFAHRYKLLKNTPTYKAGWELGWDGGSEKFYFYKPSTWSYNKGEPDIYLDLNGARFTVDEIKNIEWFEPIGEEVDFIPKFPTQKKLEEYFYMFGETRLVSDVDLCRAIDKLLDDKGFQKKLYEFYKREYNQFYKLTNK